MWYVRQDFCNIEFVSVKLQIILFEKDNREQTLAEVLDCNVRFVFGYSGASMPSEYVYQNTILWTLHSIHFVHLKQYSPNSIVLHNTRKILVPKEYDNFI